MYFAYVYKYFIVQGAEGGDLKDDSVEVQKVSC